MICRSGALADAPDGWLESLLLEGELAMLVDAEGLDGINAVARTADVPTVRIVRAEDSADAQERTVQTYAGDIATVWIDAAFSDAVRTWAHDRGPMTLLVESGGALPAEEHRRIERFVAILGRQSD
jgi:hypothetical protein